MSSRITEKVEKPQAMQEGISASQKTPIHIEGAGADFRSATANTTKRSELGTLAAHIEPIVDVYVIFLTGCRPLAFPGAISESLDVGAGSAAGSSQDNGWDHENGQQRNHGFHDCDFSTVVLDACEPLKSTIAVLRVGKSADQARKHHNSETCMNRVVSCQQQNVFLKLLMPY
jgi:hypothetical protein